MTVRTDRKVFGLAILIVGVFVTTAAGWGVPLIGSSHRWAAAVILLLGLAAAAFSAPGAESRSYTLAGFVIVAFLAAVLALATASTTAVALLVAALHRAHRDLHRPPPQAHVPAAGDLRLPTIGRRRSASTDRPPPSGRFVAPCRRRSDSSSSPGDPRLARRHTAPAPTFLPPCWRPSRSSWQTSPTSSSAAR